MCGSCLLPLTVKKLLSPPVSNFKMKKDWNKYEEELDASILDKMPFFTVTARYVGFATDNKDEYEQLGNEYHHIIFTDRSNIGTCYEENSWNPKVT
jgi:hypothetical protein